MFARGFLFLHRAALSASLQNFANSNHSRTYATPGWGYLAFSNRPSQINRNASHTHNFFLSGICIPCPQVLSLRLLRKNRGLGASGHTNSPTRSNSSPRSMLARHESPVAGYFRPPVTIHQSPLLSLFSVLQWRASVPISSGESLHA